MPESKCGIQVFESIDKDNRGSVDRIELIDAVRPDPVIECASL